MGLAERRAAKNYADNSFPAQEAAIHAAAGFAVPIEVDWSSLAVDAYSHLYEEAFTKVYFEPLIAAFANICVDDMGREALKAGLKSVKVQNTGGHHSFRGFTFEDGVLLIDHKPATNIGDVKDRTQGITNLLEKAL